jgi:hypothetical protein
MSGQCSACPCNAWAHTSTTRNRHPATYAVSARVTALRAMSMSKHRAPALGAYRCRVEVGSTGQGRSRTPACALRELGCHRAVLRPRRQPHTAAAPTSATLRHRPPAHHAGPARPLALSRVSKGRQAIRLACLSSTITAWRSATGITDSPRPPNVRSPKADPQMVRFCACSPHKG